MRRIYICYDESWGLHLDWNVGAVEWKGFIVLVKTSIDMPNSFHFTDYKLKDPFTITCDGEVIYTVTDPQDIAKIQAVLITNSL